MFKMELLQNARPSPFSHYMRAVVMKSCPDPQQPLSIIEIALGGVENLDLFVVYYGSII